MGNNPSCKEAWSYSNDWVDEDWLDVNKIRVKTRNTSPIPAWSLSNPEQEEDIKKTRGKIYDDKLTASVIPAWFSEEDLPEDDFKKTREKIRVETRKTSPIPAWSLSNPEQERDIKKTRGKIHDDTLTASVIPAWFSEEDLPEDDFKKTREKIRVETRKTTPIPAWSCSKNWVEEDWLDVKKTRDKTRNTSPIPAWSLSNPEQERDIKKTHGKIYDDTLTASVIPAWFCEEDLPEDDFKKTREKIRVETRKTSPIPACSFSNDWLEEEFKKRREKFKNRREMRVKTRKTSAIPEEHKLAQKLRDLVYSNEETDIVLRVQDRDFRSHRAILAARSTVLAAMFKHDIKEKVSGVVQIEDCDPDAFEIFLKHLHTGSIEFSKDTVTPLYQIADKYDTPDLREKCVDFMSRTISVDTFCEVAKLSLEYNESELLKETVKLFMKNIRQVSLSIEWQTFQKEHPLLANEFNLKILEYHGIQE